MKKLSWSFLLLSAVLLAILPAGVVSASAPSSGAVGSGGVLGTQNYHPHPAKPYVAPRALPGPQVTTLQTVPPVPGVTFQIAGQQFVTGADGTTVVMVPQPGLYDLQIITDTFHDPYRRVEFSRWVSESFQPTRQIHLPSTNPVVQVGLNTYELVGQKFVDPDGAPVSPQRISSFTIRSVQGDSFTFKDGQPRWIPASRVTRRRDGGLDEVKLLYTVSNVTVDGSNVVNKSQQQFYAQPNGVWTISLLFYSLRVQSTDALFGFPQGKTVELTLPSGQVQTFALDSSGAAQMHNLARGDYSFRILGTMALSTRAPIALSKDQTVATKVVSYLDIAVVLGLGALLAISLFVIGRLSLRRSRVQEAELEDTRPSRVYGGT